MPAAESNLSKKWDWLKNWLGHKMVGPINDQGRIPPTLMQSS